MNIDLREGIVERGVYYSCTREGPLPTIRIDYQVRPPVHQTHIGLLVCMDNYDNRIW